MLIEIISPDDHDQWDAYVLGHAEATCYHLHAWRTIARNAYRIDAPFLIARDHVKGPIRGVLPLFTIRGMLQSHLTNGLFGAYGGVLADTTEARRALIDQAKQIFLATGVSHLMLKCVTELDFDYQAVGLRQVDSWVIATLDLKLSADAMWTGLRNKIRNCVRKAQSHQLETRIGTCYLADFYDVLAENMHDKGAPIYGLRFMKELVRTMQGRADVITLWQGSRAVAGALLLDFRGTTYVPFASSRPGARFMSPNNLLYWEIIKRGCEKGIQRLDFGRSLKGSGPLDFKLGWGAQVRPQPAYLCSVTEKSIEIDAKDRRVEWFVKQWKRLPRPVVNAVGPEVCRQLAGLI